MTAVGLLFLFAPGMLKPSGDFSLPDAPSRIEIRAVYGGVELAIGLFLLACVARKAWMGPGLFLAALVGLCAGGGRIVGAVAEAGIDWKVRLGESLSAKPDAA